MWLGCSEACGERDCDPLKTKESLHHCCLNGDKVRLLMYLIRREVVTRDHTFRVRGVEVKYSRAGSHEAEWLRTRLVDMDSVANRSYSCADRAGVVPVPCLGEKVKAIIRWTGTWEKNENVLRDVEPCCIGG